MIKVCHIVNNFHINKLYSLLLSKLESHCVENYIFDPLNNKDAFEETITDHMLVKKCFNTFDRFLFYSKQNKMLKELEKHFDMDSFNVIHAHTLFSGGYSAYKLNQKYNMPYVVAVRNTDVNVFFKYVWYLRSVGVEIMRHAKAVIFLSSAYKDKVIREYVSKKLQQEIALKSCVIPNGIDDFWHSNKYDGEHLLHNPIRLIFAGRVDRNKNIPTIIQTMDILRKRDVDTHLTIVGPVEDKEVFNKFSQHSQVRYHDAVPKEKLIDYYREADIFVMPSFTETFGLVYAEAMSQGLPVIYSKGQGFDGQFEDGEVGFAADSHSPKDVADKIELVCKNYSQFSQSAVVKVDKFRWDKIAEEYNRLYVSIM